MRSRRSFHPIAQWRDRATTICNTGLREAVLALEPHIEALCALDGVLRLFEKVSAAPSLPAARLEALNFAECADREAARTRSQDRKAHACEGALQKASVRQLVLQLYRLGQYPFTHVVLRCGRHGNPKDIAVPTSFALAHPWHPSVWTSSVDPELRNLVLFQSHLVVRTLLCRDADYALGHRLSDDHSVDAGHDRATTQRHLPREAEH